MLQFYVKISDLFRGRVTSSSSASSPRSRTKTANELSTVRLTTLKNVNSICSCSPCSTAAANTGCHICSSCSASCCSCFWQHQIGSVEEVRVTAEGLERTGCSRRYGSERRDQQANLLCRTLAFSPSKQPLLFVFILSNHITSILASHAAVCDISSADQASV